MWADPTCSGTVPRGPFWQEGHLGAGRAGGSQGAVSFCVCGPSPTASLPRTGPRSTWGTERTPEPSAAAPARHGPPLPCRPAAAHPLAWPCPGAGAGSVLGHIPRGSTLPSIHGPACHSQFHFAPDDDTIAIYHPDIPGVESEAMPRLGPSATRLTGPQSPGEPRASPMRASVGSRAGRGLWRRRG